ncbi:MAG TPA: glycosyltransferase [Candidatus Omnitrophica bacterium]|nr:glycosyltransferase [Candidatus Omnitrophota bacterium]
MSDMAVSIIIPVCNEEQNIRKVIEDINSILRSEEKEIIVIDDGSRDATQSVVKNIAEKLSVQLITHRENLGYGASIKQGMKKAKHDNILIIDGDGTYPVEAIPKILKEIKDGDMVVGARVGKNVRFPFFRRPVKFFFNTLASYLVNRRIPDLNSGLRIFNKKIALRFFSLLPDTFSFTSTITLAFLTNGYSVRYIPIDYYTREGGKSKISPLRDLINFFILIIRMVMYFNPLKIFLPLSLIVILVGLFVLFYTAVVIGRVMDITSIVILLAGIQIAVIGLLADLIVKRIRL